MSPWLIVTVEWPRVAATLAALTACVAAHPVTDATVATTTLVLGCGVVLRHRSRARPDRPSTS